MTKFADRFDSDRKGFEIDREIGRRFIMGKRNGREEVDEKTDALYKEDYGEEALAHIIKRTRELLDRFG